MNKTFPNNSIIIFEKTDTIKTNDIIITNENLIRRIFITDDNAILLSDTEPPITDKLSNINISGKAIWHILPDDVAKTY